MLPMLGRNKARKFKRVFSKGLLVILEIGTSMLIKEIPLVCKEVMPSINLLFVLSTNKLKCGKKSISIISLLT